ncbi:MAG: glycoside hydrolase family 1 protein [Anaerolineae bacterium]|nr:glycoside hydrolase family 1 protein [Anaerolineae bacterium]
MPAATFHFPPDFKWGVATSSHQVEGDNKNNQWWVWEHLPDHIAADGKSGLACDWWQHAEADFDIAARMGLNAMRLSIEWSRIEIAPGQIDTTALERYRTMLESLLAQNIEPMVTLHHFTNPMWFEDEGGWLSHKATGYFTRYVEQVVRALGDLTNLWCTINEPNFYAYMGYMKGDFPPGAHDFRAAVKVQRNMLLAHASAYRTIHQLQENARVGLAHNICILEPLNPKNLLDRIVTQIQDVIFNKSVLRAVGDGWWMLPMGIGPAFATRHTVDWIGLNYYTRHLVTFDRSAKDSGYGKSTHLDNAELMDGGYGELYPRGMRNALKRLEPMGIPIYITENGIPDADDDQRPRALLLHLQQVWKMMQNNLPIKGYYHWTLTDNFEWAEGWSLRFGLLELDPETQKRVRRPSADLYSGLAKGNAITPELVKAYAPEILAQLYPA